MMTISCVESDSVARVAEVLLKGGVAIIPTDTVYGLAAHPDCPEAVSRLSTIKGRSHTKPIALLAADTQAVEKFVGYLSPQTQALAEQHWPGALTLVLPYQQRKECYEGLRVPNHDWTRKLLDLCGGVLRVTSANLSGSLPARDAEAAYASLGMQADILADDGVSPGGTASTVAKVDFDGTVTVLRAGPIGVN